MDGATRIARRNSPVLSFWQTLSFEAIATLRIFAATHGKQYTSQNFFEQLLLRRIITLIVVLLFRRGLIVGLPCFHAFGIKVSSKDDAMVPFSSFRRVELR